MASKRRQPNTSTENTNTEENSNMTDTDTSIPEDAVQGSEPEATEEQPAEQAPAANPEPEGPPAEDVLKDIVRNALANADENGALRPEDTEQLQSVYKKVPAARRGSVQAEIMREALTSPNVNTDAVANVLQEMVRQPTGKGRTTRQRVEVPAEQLAAEAITTLRIAEQAIVAELESDELRTKATELAEERLTATLEGEALDAFLKGVTKVVNAVTKKARKASTSGGDGNRETFEDTIAKIVERGDLTVGTVVKHGDDFTATVTSNGLEVKGTNYESPSSAATKGCGVKSVNGWEFWKLPDGKALGSLRKK